MNMRTIFTEFRSETNPTDFVQSRLGFQPDPNQELVLLSEVRRGLLNCCRQWGKSTTTAAKAVYHAFHAPESLTLVLSPSARQSGEFIRKAAGFLSRLGIKPRGDGGNEISLVLPNRARIVGLPGKENTIRGFSGVTLLIVDEAARVPDDLYFALRPTIATAPDAAIWLMSTPHGQHGFFYEEWTNPEAPWTRIEVRATDCPRISPKFLEEERKTLGEHWFAQEYLCRFAEDQRALFRTEDLEALLSPHVQTVDLNRTGPPVITPTASPGVDPYKPRFLPIY